MQPGENKQFNQRANPRVSGLVENNQDEDFEENVMTLFNELLLPLMYATFKESDNEVKCKQ